jgi:RNA polymerase sigma-70 factor (ECF subfamily)
VEDFQTYYPLMFGIAYRMLGSASEAEDIVQEAYLRYAAASRDEVRSLKAYLTTIVTRLCLDHLKSARVRREQYVGPWLPEPLLTTGTAGGPLQTLEQRESLSMAFLVLLEVLNPQERAVFLLREVFEYGYDEIGAILDRQPAHCRQLFHRAQARIAERRRRFTPAPETQRRLLGRFLAACQQGDLAALTQVLAADVTMWADGGGKVAAARRPIEGAAAVARFFLGLARIAPADYHFTLAEVNGAPALLLWVAGKLDGVYTFEASDDQILAFRIVRNPDKLVYLARQAREPGADRPLTAADLFPETG